MAKKATKKVAKKTTKKSAKTSTLSLPGVQAQVSGGEMKKLEAATVGDVRAQLGVEDNYQAQVNGVPANDTQALANHDFVTFAVKVKGN